MKVPPLDLHIQYLSLENELKTAIFKVINNTNFILGKEVQEFEEGFAKFIGCKNAVGVASGLDALKMSLRALDIGSGDEVITAANTFIATALAISSVGAIPALVDVDNAYYNIDVNKIEAAITPKTKALMPVHLYGQPAQMDSIIRIARKHNLFIIEDASQAHGAVYKGKRIGCFGNIAAFSLYPGKNLGAYGDAGILVSDDDAIADRIRTLRNYGSKTKYYHLSLGENSRLDTIQAAVVNAKLPHLEKWNDLRRKIAARYSNYLDHVGDLILPKTYDDCQHVYHQYVIRTKKRKELMQYLGENQVGTIIHYPIPIHLQEAYKHMNWKKGDFPVTEALCDEVLSLPMYPELTDEQCDYVIEKIKKFFS